MHTAQSVSNYDICMLSLDDVSSSVSGESKMRTSHPSRPYRHTSALELTFKRSGLILLSIYVLKKDFSCEIKTDSLSIFAAFLTPSSSSSSPG